MSDPTPEIVTHIALIVLDKFYQGVGSEIGKHSVNFAVDKIKALGELVWENCFKRYQNNIELLEGEIAGSSHAKQQLLLNITDILESNPLVKEEVLQLTQNIYAEAVMKQRNTFNFEAQLSAKAMNFNQGVNHITQNFG